RLARRDHDEKPKAHSGLRRRYRFLAGRLVLAAPTPLFIHYCESWPGETPSLVLFHLSRFEDRAVIGRKPCPLRSEFGEIRMTEQRPCCYGGHFLQRMPPPVVVLEPVHVG